MTETTTPDTPETDARVVPEGCDPLDDLTAGELGHVGKLLKADPYEAAQQPALGLRWPALAHLAWVWEKRTDPKAKLSPWLDRKPAELIAALGLEAEGGPEDDQDTDAQGDDQAPEANPTDSGHAS